jgi:hypothetical protein
LTAYTPNTGGDVFYDTLTSPSVNATLDTYTISNNTRLVLRTDSYACANHSAAAGSLDTVSYSGIGGTLRFDPTYVRHVAYTAGSGNSPAYGAAISQGGVSGVFLGAWANWQSDPVAAGAAIPATGFIKIGGTTGGEWAAGALTGIAATCSGASVQSWMEVRGADTGSITVPRVGAVEAVEAWCEIGTTNGSRGQVIQCPTTATVAGTFPAIWIETSAGSGVYDRYAECGSTVALATHRTSAEMKLVKQTTSGIAIGNDGTNGVFYLPPTGCKVRIPAVILTTCTRTAGGSGARVLPNATLATRQEFITTNAGAIDLRGVSSQWYMNFVQAYSVKLLGCGIKDTLVLSEVAAPLDIDNVVVSPTQAQINTALNMSSCFSGGTVQNSNFWRFSLAASGNYVSSINYCKGVAFNSVVQGSLTLRANGTTGAITATQSSNCTFTNCTSIGGRNLMVGCKNITATNQAYYDHTITTTTTSTNPMSIWEFTTGSSDNVVDGVSMPNTAVGPYTALVTASASYNTLTKNIGTSYTAPFAMNSSVTGLGVNATGNCDGVILKRVYLSNTRTGLYAYANSDNNIVVENSSGDAADTTVTAGLNATIKNVMFTSATTGQVSVYGTHWITRFTSTTAGFAEILCNEPTASSAAQCQVTAGTPRFNSSGSVLLTSVGDQVVWEMPFFAIGYTAFTNSAPTITGTNVTFSSGSTWGNHTLEFQVDTGSGYGGSWLALNAATLIANTFNSTTGFKLKIRATCLTANAGNVLTNLRVALTTTSTDRDTKLYPLSVGTVQIEGLVTGSRVKATAIAGGAVLFNGSESSGSVAFQTDHTGAIAIEARKASAAPFYIPWNTQLTPITNSTVSATALQQLDE